MLGLKVQDNADFGAEIIRKVREHQGLSRVELARELGVAASTIGRHVDALVAGSYFMESVEPTKEAGRPPTRLRPNSQRGCFLGVDFNARTLYATAVDFAQQPIVQKSFPISGDSGAEVVLQEVAAALQEMKESTRLPVLSAGVATPGKVDSRRGLAIGYSFIKGFTNIPIGVMMSQVVEAPVYVENNIRTMALAERWFGRARGCQDVICLGVRIGVSAGVIHNGELTTGHRELGGEIRGWNCPVFDGVKEEWSWDATSTIEQHASVTAVVKRYNSRSGRRATHTQYLDAALAGDTQALTAMREAAAMHGWAISQMVQLADPEMVVLAGPLTALGDVYLDAVSKVAHQFASTYAPAVPILISELGEFAGAVGAAALALERWRPDALN